MTHLHLVGITGEVVYNRDMDLGLKLKKANQYLERASRPEASSARRNMTLRFLYHERYLTRRGLSWRLEMALGYAPFWLVFIQDMWLVRKAFQAANYQLVYSWKGERRGYHLWGEGELSPEMERTIQGAVAEVDRRQVEITRAS